MTIRSSNVSRDSAYLCPIRGFMRVVWNLRSRRRQWTTRALPGEFIVTMVFCSIIKMLVHYIPVEQRYSFETMWFLTDKKLEAGKRIKRNWRTFIELITRENCCNIVRLALFFIFFFFFSFFKVESEYNLNNCSARKLNELKFISGIVPDIIPTGYYFFIYLWSVLKRKIADWYERFNFHLSFSIQLKYLRKSKRSDTKHVKWSMMNTMVILDVRKSTCNFSIFVF